MKQFFAMIAVLLAFSVPSWAAESRFFAAMGDIPLMQGLTEMPDESTLFDTAEGRVADLSARIGQGNAANVRAFYDATLPQMGWMKIGEGAFSRDDERLGLKIENGVLHIAVMPNTH
jgi:hypothetical protein